MAVLRKHWDIDKFSTFEKTIAWKKADKSPKNLTGWTGKMDIRSNYNDNTPELTLTTLNGGIVVDGPNGLVTLYITDEQTGAMTVPETSQNPMEPAKALYVYDLFMESPDGKRYKILAGTIHVFDSVTQ